MIKFFRKIRYHLMEQGKTRKYLTYAIGEIVLVVIGILIALQINNWNEEQQSLKEMDRNLQNLVEDLQSNKNQLLDLISQRQTVSADAGFLLDNYETQKPISENEFITRIYPVLSEQYFEIYSSGIDKVLSSPVFEIDRMERIRELIKSYLRIARNLSTYEAKENSAIENMEMITAGNGYFKMIWRNFRKNRYQTTTDYNNPAFDFLNIMDNDELLYILFRYEFVTQFSLKRYNELIETGDQIIAAVDNYRNTVK